jgi:uncharacterized membrane protein
VKDAEEYRNEKGIGKSIDRIESAISRRYFITAIFKRCPNMLSKEKSLMRAQILIMIFSLTLILIPCRVVHSQNRAEYTIQINTDGSAAWTIGLTVGVNETYDDVFQLQNRVSRLVEAARSKTQRDMDVLEDSLSSTYTLVGSYIVIEYKFLWANFSRVENTSITIGDVFQTPSFFLQLFGDGRVHVAYPSSYSIETALPPPSKRDDSVQILEWPGTNDFDEARIVLREKSASSGLAQIVGQNAILIAGLIMLLAGSSAGFYALKHRKKKGEKTMEVTELFDFPRTESAEDKVMTLLKSSGGSLNQSSIAEHCKFSKAKASQLLTALEDKGVVRRYKKGRDKIVVLVEKDESEA